MNTIIITAILGVILMLTGAFSSNKKIPKIIAIFGLLAAVACNFLELTSGSPFFDINFKSMLATNPYNLTFINVVLLCTLVYFVLSGNEIEKVGTNVAEFFALICFVLCGVSIAATFNTLLMFFIGIEIISIPLYILTASDKRNLKSNEAGLKYFLMGSFSTGIMLLGIAFIYGANATGSFYIQDLAFSGKLVPMAAVGMVLLFIALSFKVSAAPFHFWTPDVYDGAPTVFTSFMATVVKAAGFFAFMRLFEFSFGEVHEQWQKLVVVILVATLIIGNFTAVFQQSVKRMLAYSSIAQAGFMLFALFALNSKAKEGIVLYSAAYSLATIGFFAILLKMKDYTIDGFNGLFKQKPILAIAALVFLLSLTGVPLTAGFQSKLYMLVAAVETKRHMWMIIVAVLCAAVSAYYYFKVIQAIFFKPAADEQTVTENVTRGFEIAVVIVAVLVILLGLAPGLLTDWLYFAN